jgi:hypothetical protein
MAWPIYHPAWPQDQWKERNTMTVKVTLPPTHQPYLERGLLPADFYGYEELLSEAEREKVARIRD